MNLIHLLPIGDPGGGTVEYLCSALPAEIGARCEVLSAPFNAESAFHPGRQQYWSTQILAGMQAFLRPDSWRILAVTRFDLYIPILTFVFGEAQLNGPCAVLSTHRLRQEIYGLPPDPELLRQRALKEAMHELGHTLALTHCDNHSCVMAPSHAVEWIDLKTHSLCATCRSAVESIVTPSGI